MVDIPCLDGFLKLQLYKRASKKPLGFKFICSKTKDYLLGKSRYTKEPKKKKNILE